VAGTPPGAIVLHSQIPAFAAGTGYAAGTPQFAAEEGHMKTNKGDAKGERASKPRIKDLRVSDARAKGTKAGGVASTIDTIGKALSTMAQKQG
jgi:hypothetical protein